LRKILLRWKSAEGAVFSPAPARGKREKESLQNGNDFGKNNGGKEDVVGGKRKKKLSDIIGKDGSFFLPG